MTGPMIAVLGSANMDLVVTVGRMPRLGETVMGRTFRTVPGGKGANQALAAARAGGSVVFAGAVGDDDFGRRISDLLAGDGIDTSALSTTPEPTGTAHITVDDSGDNAIVVVPGANGTVTALTDAHRAMIDRAAVLLLQLELPLSVVTEAAAYARARGVRVMLTPAPAMPLSDDVLDLVEVLVLNEHESRLLADVADPGEAVAALAQRCKSVVMTLGARGSIYASGTVRMSVPAFPVAPVDTTAAGDTFAGVLAVSLAEDAEVSQALRRASAAAALSVQRFGASASMPLRSEIDAVLAEQEMRADG